MGRHLIDLEKTRDLTRSLIDATLRDGPTIELKLRAEDSALEIMGGQLELYHDEVTSGCHLVKAVTQHNYPHSPDYVDMVDVAYYISDSEAATGIVMTLAEMFIGWQYDKLADDAMAQEFAEEDHQGGV
jgi:hypothetical protein